MRAVCSRLRVRYSACDLSMGANCRRASRRGGKPRLKGERKTLTTEPTHERWSAVQQFLTHWCGPFTEREEEPLDALAELEEAEARLSVKLPHAFREWYLFTRRYDVLGGYPLRFNLSTLRVLEGFLVFHVESQWVVVWGMLLADLELPNPPVLIDKDFSSRGLPPSSHRWFEENRTFSEFVFQMTVHETLLRCTYSGNGPIDITTAKLLEGHFPNLGFPDWHWPTSPTRLLGNDDILMELNGDEWLWVVARNPTVLKEVGEPCNMEWEYLSNLDEEL